MTGKDDLTVMMGGPAGAGPALGGVLKPPKAKLICLDDSLLDPSQKGLVIQLNEKEITLGRGEENTHPIKYAKISRVHARVFPSEGKWGIEDLQSTNGVWINDVRVSTEPLKPGDYVRIGAVPFRFVLDRPDAPDLGGASGAVGSEESEHTMMFGSMTDSRAADALMVANADVEPVRAQSKTTATSSTSATAGKSPPSGSSKSKMPLLIGVGLVVLLVAGGAFFLMGGAGGEEETNALRKQLKDFSYTYEEPTGTPSGADLKAALAEVQRLRGDLAQAVDKFPKNQALRGLLAKAMFLEMERGFFKLSKEGKAQELAPLVALVEGQVTALKPAAGQPMPDEITQTLEVLAMARDMALIKTFRQKYPDPSERAVAKPSSQEMAAYQEARDDFVAKKRNPKVNAVLSVAFAFFGRMAAEVDQLDLPVLDKWKEFVR